MTLVVQIGEKSTDGKVAENIRATLKEAGCTILTKQEAEALWKKKVTEQLERGEPDAASTLAFGSVADALILGEASVESGSLRISLKRVDPVSGKEIWTSASTKSAAQSKELTREATVALLGNLATPIVAPTPVVVVYFITAKPLSFSAMSDLRKAVSDFSPEMKEVVLREAIEGATVMEISTTTDVATLLDGQRIGGYKLVVSKATKDGLFINLKIANK